MFGLLDSFRIRAALTALAFVLSSLFGMIHEATTRHVVCAAHGELIDASAGTSAAASHRRTEPVSAEPRVRASDTAAVHGHDHCALTSLTRASRIVPCPPALVHATVATAKLAIAGPARVIARERALLHAAPKTSPPLA